MVNESLKLSTEVIKQPKEARQEFQYEFMSDPEQRRLLAERVDQMVEQVKNQGIAEVIFLDKSARPIAEVFRYLWDKKYPDLEKPKVDFLNVGKEMDDKKYQASFSQIKQEKEKDPDYNYEYSDDYGHLTFAEDIKGQIKTPEAVSEFFGIPLDRLESMKSTYKYLSKLDSEAQGRDQKPGVLIVDEYSNTGQSLAMAELIVGGVFPDIKTSGFSVATRNGDLFRNKDRSYEFNPPWRKRENEADYGATGVVDPKTGQWDFRAAPSWEFKPEQALESQAQIIKEGLRENLPYLKLTIGERKQELDQILAEYADLKIDQWIKNGYDGSETPVKQVKLPFDIRKELGRSDSRGYESIQDYGPKIEGLYKEIFETEIRPSLLELRAGLENIGRLIEQLGQISPDDPQALEEISTQLIAAKKQAIEPTKGLVADPKSPKSLALDSEDIDSLMLDQGLLKEKVLPHIEIRQQIDQITPKDFDVILAALVLRLEQMLSGLRQFNDYERYDQVETETRQLAQLEQGGVAPIHTRRNQLYSEMRGLAKEYFDEHYGNLKQAV